MIVQLAHSSGITEGAARQQIMKMIGGIPIGRPGVPGRSCRTGGISGIGSRSFNSRCGLRY